MNDKVTASFIFQEIQKYIEAKIPVAREAWLKIAFQLDVLRLDEAKLFNKMHRAVAEKKLEIYRKQDKKNVAATDMEIEASEEYMMMKDQEALLYSVDEMIRIAKKNSDINF